MSIADTPIGGFFGLSESPAAAPSGGGVLAAWTGDDGWIGFHNARSAFAWLVRSLGPPVVWLPRYLCADMRAAAGPRVRVYDVDDRLQLADPALAADLGPRDLVVAVAYFGAPVCDDMRALAFRRPDVTWIEDRAQALQIDPGDGMPGSWRLYSPRKLLGVADGGILAGTRIGDLPPPVLAAAPAGHAEAARMRAAAAGRAAVETAYRRYVEIEREHRVGEVGMSEATGAALSRIDPAPAAARRRANFAVLDSALGDLAAPFVARLRSSAAPFGYPIAVPSGRDALVARLAAEGLFCAVHWRALVEEVPPPSPARRLSETLVTLPLDQRYGVPEMARLAEGVRRCLA